MTNQYSNSNKSNNNHHQSHGNGSSGQVSSNFSHHDSTKNQTLFHKRKNVQQKQRENEPWLFQSIPSLQQPSVQSNGTSLMSSSVGSLTTQSLPAPPLILNTTASLSNTKAGFYLDVDSLKSLLPHSSNTITSGAYGSRRPKSSGTGPQYQPRNALAHTRLEALSISTARRKKRKRARNGRLITSHRKFALRLDAVKNRKAADKTVGGPSSVKNAAAISPTKKKKKGAHTHKHVHYKGGKEFHHQTGSMTSALKHSHGPFNKRKSVFHVLDEDDADHNHTQERPLSVDVEEEARHKEMMATQLNLTLEEYELLDQAFGGEGGIIYEEGEENDGSFFQDGRSMTERYRQMFVKYDKDGSGSISPSELRELLLAAGEEMDDAEIKSVIDQADTNHDGEINMEEFMELVRARKRILHLARTMGPTGLGPRGGNGSMILSPITFTSTKHLLAASGSSMRSPDRPGSPPATTIMGMGSPSPFNQNLPPLKLAAVQSKKHLKQFNSQFSRPTPACLRPGAQVDLTQLRRELALSEYGIQELNSKVREGLAWVQQNIPVRSLKAQIFCHKWGMEKMQQLFLRIQLYTISRGFQKWKSFCMYEQNKQKANLFLKGKATKKMNDILTKKIYQMKFKKIQKWLLECKMDARNELTAAAVEIQRILRGKKARDIVKNKQQFEACILIQSQIRGFLARQFMKRLRQAKKEFEAACLLQRSYRGYAGRVLGRALYQAQKEQLAARKIQRAFRIHQRHRMYLVIQLIKVENDSAIQIQKIARLYLARCIYLNKRQFKKELHAIQTIQRTYRGHLGRKQTRLLRQQLQAAKKIQTSYRAYTCQRVYKSLKEQKQKLIEFNRQTKAAIKIQARVRCFVQRRKYLNTLRQLKDIHATRLIRRFTSATTIQNTFRGFKARRISQQLRFEKLKWLSFTLMNQSALKIQKCWRGYHGRLVYQYKLKAQRELQKEEEIAAIKIQAIARGTMGKKEFKQRQLVKQQQFLQAKKRQLAAVNIQKIFRGTQARILVQDKRHLHEQEAKKALERLLYQTKHRAALKIQCCIRRYFAKCRYFHQYQVFLIHQKKQEELFIQTKACLVIQCTWRQRKARVLLLQRRREFEKKLSLMASEKAQDEIEKLRQQQEEELTKLKMSLLFEKEKIHFENLRLKEEMEQNVQKQIEKEKQEWMTSFVANQMGENTKLQQQTKERFLERHLKIEQFEENEQKKEQQEISKLKMELFFQKDQKTQMDKKQVQMEREKLQKEQQKMNKLQKEHASYKIQKWIYHKQILPKRYDKLEKKQQEELQLLHDEETKKIVQLEQEKKKTLQKIKDIMDQEKKEKEKELKEMEFQMLQRAIKEKEKMVGRNVAARQIQKNIRGFLDRQRVKQMQTKIQKEREEKMKQFQKTLEENFVQDEKEEEVDDTKEEEYQRKTINLEEWVEYWDENAQASYFYNIRTQEASWTRPVTAPKNTSTTTTTTKTNTTAAAAALRATTTTPPPTTSPPTPTMDYNEDNYTPSTHTAMTTGTATGATATTATTATTTAGYDGYDPNAAATGYADEYGFYDQYGQYHYYDEQNNPNTQVAAAAMGYGNVMPMGIYPGFFPSPFMNMGMNMNAQVAQMTAAMVASQMVMMNQMQLQQQQQQQQPIPIQTQQFGTVGTSSVSDGTTDPNAPAAPAAAPAPPSAAAVADGSTDPWGQYYDQYTGAMYYYNSITGEKYWA